MSGKNQTVANFKKDFKVVERRGGPKVLTQKLGKLTIKVLLRIFLKKSS